MESSDTSPRTGSLWGVLRAWTDPFHWQNREETALFVLTLLIGAIVGLVVVAFIVVTENLGSRMYPAGGSAWRRLVIPTLGALITGFLLYRHFPNARGSGIPQTKTALFLREGVIYFRTVLGKFFLSAVSLASGISLGREGPSVQVGAGIASTLGRRIGLGPNRIKSLIPIGSAAALAAAFNTPIAAVLFTLEEVMGDLNAPVLGAIVLSSATSWIVLHLLLGDEPLFHVPAYQLVHPVEFLFYAVLGLVGGLVSVSFVKLLLWLRKGFFRMPKWTAAYQPVAGGLLVGVMGWFVPDVLGVGYNHVSQALNGQLVLRTMALLVVLKLVATAMCYASGNAGGIFGPALFIGAMMGGAVGGAAHFILPDYTGSVGAYALVGMGAAFAGIIRVPLTSVIMIFEVTRDYSIIVPLMIANLISYFISSRLQEEPIYEALLAQDGIRLPRGAREREQHLTVAHGVRPASGVIAASDTVEEALGRAPSEQSIWPVVDSGGLLGVITRDRLQQAANESGGNQTVGSLMPVLGPWDAITTETFPHVHPDQALDTALRRMAQSGLDALPVVSRSNQRQLLGVISVHNALAAYGAESNAEEPAYKESRTPMRLLAGLLIVLVAMVGIAGILNYMYREQRSSRATEYYQTGNKLMSTERYPEAVEQYRNALSISHLSRDRLALALALEKAGRSGEAEVYFREVLRDNHDSGPANLGLGQMAADRGDVRQ
ncbi:MAG: chloride channel protein, partial [Acidobacteriia bacterium]|nr:chloride channel protein [Terriglobia bacterium]